MRNDWLVTTIALRY